MFLILFLSQSLWLHIFLLQPNFFLTELEENVSKPKDNAPGKAVVKERVLEKIDLSKGI